MNVSCIPRIGHSIARGSPSIPGRILEAPEHPEMVHILTRISTSGSACQTLNSGNFKVSSGNKNSPIAAHPVSRPSLSECGNSDHTQHCQNSNIPPRPSIANTPSTCALCLRSVGAFSMCRSDPSLAYHIVRFPSSNAPQKTRLITICKLRIREIILDLLRMNLYTTGCFTRIPPK